MTKYEKQAHFAATNALRNAFVDCGAGLLEAAGVFGPHGAALSEAGEMKLMSVDTGDSDGAPSPKAVLSVIHAGLREQTKEGGITAVGSAQTVMIGEPPEPAIKVFAEHASGFCMAFYLPFQTAGDDGYHYGEVMRVDSKRLISGWQSAH